MNTNIDTAIEVLRQRIRSKVFHRLPEGDYGLLVWYPNAKPPKGDEEEEGTAPPSTSSKTLLSANGSASGKNAADVLFAALTAAGKPLSRGELLKSAAGHGVPIDKSTASQIMSRDNRFNGVGRGRGAKWELKK